jgi:transposase
MRPHYAAVSAVKKCFPNWDELIAFDRFHVVNCFLKQLFLGALNKVRAREHKKFLENEGESVLTKLKFELFRNSGNTDNRGSKRRGFLDIMRMHLQSSRAWKIKETQNSLWEYSYMGSAEKNWKRLIRWMLMSRIDEMKKLAHTIKDHLWGILNAIKFKATNALLESTNSVIQHIKRMACGYRNDASFRTAILFHLGGLDLAVPSPHNA